MKKRIFIISVAAISVATLFGCSRSQHSVGALPGSWGTDSGDALSLRKDGTFSLTNLLPNKVVSKYSGTYTLVDSNHIKMTIETAKGRFSTTYQFSDSDGVLTVQDPDSKKVKTYHHAIN
jgi:major membrane immunogen (membrane-anchored lipoprotein)